VPDGDDDGDDAALPDGDAFGDGMAEALDVGGLPCAASGYTTVPSLRTTGSRRLGAPPTKMLRVGSTVEPETPKSASYTLRTLGPTVSAPDLPPCTVMTTA
jgi:hypothetical protein